MATVLIVEDEPDIQELVAYNIRRAGHKALQSANAEQAQAMVRAELPDLVILDWMLPGMSGVDFARWLRSNKRTQAVPIIMLTVRGDEEHKVTGLEAGADDYMTKPFSPRELIARMNAVMRRRAPQMTEDAVQMEGLMIDPASHRVTASDQPIAIGPTEYRLLHFFMTHPERVYTRSQILDNIWGDHVFLEERTVDVHIRRLRKALAPSGHDRLVQTVRSTGYRFSGRA